MPLVLIDGAYGGNGRSALTKSDEGKKALALRKADDALLVGLVSGISVGVKVLIREGFVRRHSRQNLLDRFLYSQCFHTVKAWPQQGPCNCQMHRQTPRRSAGP
jgi:hypothetical protein